MASTKACEDLHKSLSMTWQILTSEERWNKKVSSGGSQEVSSSSALLETSCRSFFPTHQTVLPTPPIPTVTLADKDTQRMRPGWSWQKQIFKPKEMDCGIFNGFMIYFFTIGSHFPCSDVLIGISWTVDFASGYSGCANARLSELSQEKI